MFQVRSMAEIITCRCVEVETDAAYLSTEFSYFVVANELQIIYVWKGQNVTENDHQHCLLYVERFAKETGYQIEFIDELNEPDEFWNVLGGKKDYLTVPYARNSARLFRCTNDQGFYAIRERYADFCQV